MTSPTPNQKKMGRKEVFSGYQNKSATLFPDIQDTCSNLKKTLVVLEFLSFLVTPTPRWNAGAIILSFAKLSFEIKRNSSFESHPSSQRMIGKSMFNFNHGNSTRMLFLDYEPS